MPAPSASSLASHMLILVAAIFLLELAFGRQSVKKKVYLLISAAFTGPYTGGFGGFNPPTCLGGPPEKQLLNLLSYTEPVVLLHSSLTMDTVPLKPC